MCGGNCVGRVSKCIGFVISTPVILYGGSIYRIVPLYTPYIHTRRMVKAREGRAASQKTHAPRSADSKINQKKIGDGFGLVISCNAAIYSQQCKKKDVGVHVFLFGVYRDVFKTLKKSGISMQKSLSIACHTHTS